MAVGICSLTGKLGTYVRSHMIPLAFTKATGGEYFVEGRPGVRPFRRHTSWYDPKLVTRDGEDVLADLDSRAAVELRAMRLVWSSWEENEKPLVWAVAENDTETRYRLIEGHDYKLLRRFFISLLWRAAASNMKEYTHVRLSSQSLERTKSIVLGAGDDDALFFPVQLVQLSTRGPRHNMGPIRMTMPFRGSDLRADLVSYRFYFDGLIVNYFLNVPPDLLADTKALYVGATDSLQVVGIPYEASFQRANMDSHQKEAWENFPSDIKKLLR